MDVLSNIPFVIVGLLGIAHVGKSLRKNGSDASLVQYLVFFLGVLLTGLGSTYYHYAPSNHTLFWDRLAMTIAFVGLFCSVVSELISPRLSIILLFPLLALGMGSVFYWYWSENLGCGDLRLYALVQFLPGVLIPSILVMYKPPRNYLRYLVGLMILYSISKIFELFDAEVFRFLKSISGHTLKHLIAAAGTCCVLRMLYSRENRPVH